ncbi:hypothetical protein GOV06_01420, partial [Candidatus Woesearchaeota archaeon]|nr:hypothetical protein [Candidatus Woesearchaeota archaeon]
DPYKAFLETLKQDFGSDNSLSEEELERIIKREQISAMINNSLDRPDVDEKEKYTYWKELNKMWNMIRIDMQLVANNSGRGVFYF